jgi:REP element-mobilizing transposase RayT
MGIAWNNRYHVTVHAYGSWVRGDPRGWRSRNHREDVEGDYKKPPPKGEFDDLLSLSIAMMKRDPIRIASEIRELVVRWIVEKLRDDKIEILVASVDSKHLHFLARFPDQRARHWTGRAKKHSSHMLRQAGLRDAPGGIWGKRSHPEPITSRAHQLKTFKYILNHAVRGAAVWRFDRDTRK